MAMDEAAISAPSAPLRAAAAERVITHSQSVLSQVSDPLILSYLKCHDTK